jgi:hypothetical protein
MYSAKIVAKRQAELESTLGSPLHRYTVPEVEAWVAHLDKRREKLAARSNKTVDEITRRMFSPEEQAFMRNESLLCAIDFEYWRERYCWIIADPDLGQGGGLQRMRPTEGQVHLGKMIARMEEEQTEAAANGATVDGILIGCHKTRQHGITMDMRARLIHRVTTQPHIRAIGGSIDDEKVMKLYERDTRIIDHLPFWLKPHLGYEEKAGHLVFDKLDSSLLYQELVQKAGIGQGEQYDMGHFTEVASVPYFSISLENDYQPTIPQAPWVLHVLETTPLGRDNWWRFFVEDMRKGNTRWKCCVLPWYIGARKYRKTPPADWQPSIIALQHAEKVWDTSKEYTGEQILLPKDCLYWWEQRQEQARRKNALQWFYTNYWSTVEESFQATTDSIFSQEILDHYRTQTRTPKFYEVMDNLPA